MQPDRRMESTLIKQQKVRDFSEFYENNKGLILFEDFYLPKARRFALVQDKKENDQVADRLN